MEIYFFLKWNGFELSNSIQYHFLIYPEKLPNSARAFARNYHSISVPVPVPVPVWVPPLEKKKRSASRRKRRRRRSTSSSLPSPSPPCSPSSPPPPSPAPRRRLRPPRPPPPPTARAPEQLASTRKGGEAAEMFSGEWTPPCGSCCTKKYASLVQIPCQCATAQYFPLASPR